MFAIFGSTGGDVAVLHERLVMLGVAVPDAELREDRFGPGTEAAVRQFQVDAGLVVTGALDQATAAALGLTTPKSVGGLVCRPDGAVLAGVGIRLAHGLGGERLVAEAKSGADGTFEMPWPERVRGGLTIAAEGGAPQVVVPSEAGTVWVRLVVGGTYRGAVRMTKVLDAVTSVLGHRGLREVGRQRDELKRLGELARVPAVELSRLALADRLEEVAQIPSAVFFGLFAQQVPRSVGGALAHDAGLVVLDDAQVTHVLDTILQLRHETVRGALEAAVAAGAVAALDVEGAMKLLHERRLARVAERPYRTGKTAFRDILATWSTDAAMQRRVFEALAAHRGSRGFWKELEGSGALPADRLRELRFTLRTSVALRNHLPLLTHVQRQRAVGAIASTSDLARLDAAAWGKLLRETDPQGDHLTFTANLRFRNLDERIDHFAQLLTAQFERNYPTAAFAGRLASHRDVLGLAAAEGVQALLDRKAGLSLRRTHIDRFVRDAAPEVFAGIEPRAAVVADLKKVQRVYKLSPRFAHAHAMLSRGYTSAYAVATTDRTRFVAAMTSAGVSRRTARRIHARAGQAHATTLALLGNFNAGYTSVAPAVVARGLSSETLQPVLADLPNLQSLFGANDYCACTHCRSIHGPAAYLVDILQFLRRRAATAGTARDVLLGRRPDLGAVELTCENTTGIVPYIDLACEVLEDAVIAPDAATLRARQTSGTEAERFANPQFVNEAVYARLRDAVFPQAVPFDLWTAEVRAYLRQLGVEWPSLLAAYQIAGQPSGSGLGAARLGLDAATLAIVADGAPAQPWTHWGLEELGNSVPDPRKPDDATAMVTGRWLEVLAFVPIALHRANVTHRELVQILGTRFVNPTGAIRIVETSTDGFASCDTGKQAIETWTPEALSRFGRFVRLLRHLGCAVWDLDKVLSDPAIGGGALDADVVERLGHFVEVAQRLAVPWDELLGLWSTMDRADYLDVLGSGERVVQSVYARRFRNPTVTLTSSVFVEDPTTLSGLLGDAEVIAGISAALGMSVEDLDVVRRAAGLDAPTAPLDLANLSAVFRYAVLAAGLRRRVGEVVTAIAVTGIDPFSSPGATLAFVDALDRAQRTGFSLHELDYLLCDGSSLESGIALAESRIVGWLDDLRRGLVRLAGDGAELVARRIGDVLQLDAELGAQLVALALPGSSSTIAQLFTDPRLVDRAADGTFVHSSSRSSFGPIFDAFIVLDKLRTVLARWRIATADARWLLANAGGAGWLELVALPASSAAPVAFDRFADLRENVALQQALIAPDESRLFDVVTGRGQPRDDVARALAALGGWSAEDVIAIADRFAWSTGAALVADATAVRIKDLLVWPRKLGTTVAECLGFCTLALAPGHARKARQLAKARHSLADWYDVAAKIQDGLRERKRKALVARLVSNPDATRGQQWFSVEELYGALLIDPEMSACAKTTRIKQAAASVQLFVQRCFLHREPQIVVDGAADKGWAEWEWMKRFRLWEANRKVFLYPENWLDPSHRRFKSSFFSEMEHALQQGAVDHAAAEDAVLEYLHKLAGVAHLEVCGVCPQFDYGRELLHVVARTRTAPHVHYTRRLGATGIWSPWEKLDIELDGVHVMPVFWNRRLYLFWPVFQEKSLPSTSNDRRVPTGGGGVSSEPSRYWEIGLAWVEKRREKWMPKRVTKLKQLALGASPRDFVLKAPVVGRRLVVDLYRQVSADYLPHIAQWRFSSGDDEPVLLHVNLSTLSGLEAARSIGALAIPDRKPSLIRSSTLTWDHNGLRGGAPNVSVQLSLLEGGPQEDLTVLRTITHPAVMVEHRDPQFTSQSPFFLSDGKRTFFVTPSFQSTNPYSRQVPSGEEPYTTRYWPNTFYHPFVDTFIQELSFGGVDALYNPRLQSQPDVYRGTGTFDFATVYQPTEAVAQRVPPAPPYPIEIVDFSHEGAYSVYNWELFFHLPLLIAERLTDNQRHEEALRWFHYIFNPTVATGGTAPQRYWIPRMFKELSAEDYAAQRLERLLQLINQGDPELERKVAEWRADPFDPHLIAAARPVAYQKSVVMKYVETLIAWGDRLFRTDTIETINEATQLYLMAGELLGPRPQDLRAMQPRPARTYDELAPQLDAFSNAVVEIENVISVPPPLTAPQTAPLPDLHTFYFCIPPNEKLFALWDTVADRLFKIRHCLDIDGVARPLALYEPPIDPGMLVRGTAAGINLSTILSDVEVDLPHYRFTAMWSVANDLCGDVRSFGAALASALERRDAEEMSRLRATQELGLLEVSRAVKLHQRDEAIATRRVLEATRDQAVVRHDYYGSREFVNSAELTGLVLGGGAVTAETAATLLGLLAAGSYTLPSFTTGGAGFGGSPLMTVTHGGETVGNAASAAANVLRMIAGTLNMGSHLAATVGGYQRRRDDWDLLQRIAGKEIVQLDRQIVAMDVRIAQLQAEVDAHDRQIEQARVVSELLVSRFTNRELYDWMVSQLSTTYFQAYQLAYDLAKRASKAYAFELGVEDPGYIQFGYWDSLHKGLHAGDKLALDLRRLQAEHLRRNARELELVKHVSLSVIDPLALVRLRQTGECFINLPEALFDLDQPGHYHRRLRTVAVTLPAVTGPFTGINATLTLVSHATRRSTEVGTSYLPAVDGDGIPLPSDPRFSRGVGAVRAIALSTGREDAGMFEVSFHDDRYLPFECLGAISHWRLELPRDTNRFDVSTLSDVILHLRYTARDGGPELRQAARDAVIAAMPRSGMRLLSARSEFPDAWARLWAPTGDGQRLEVALGDEHLPFLPPGQHYRFARVAAMLVFEKAALFAEYDGSAARLVGRLGNAASGELPTSFTPDAGLGLVPVAPIALSGPIGPLGLAFDEAAIAATPLLHHSETDADGTVHARLAREQFEDILIFVEYSIEADA